MEEYSFKGNGRELRRYINILIRKNIITNAKTVNYAKNFKVWEKWKIEKEEIKKVYFTTEKAYKLKSFLSNVPNFEKWWI